MTRALLAQISALYQLFNTATPHTRSIISCNIAALTGIHKDERIPWRIVTKGADKYLSQPPCDNR